MNLSERASATITKAEKLCKCCGQRLPNPRNEARHKLFFALLEPALNMWPETYKDFQPLSTEHLRNWLTYKANWCTVKQLELSGPNKEIAVKAVRFFLERENRDRFYGVTKTSIREYIPKSIAWNKCSEAQFKVILDSSAMLIESIIGCPIEQLKREFRNEQPTGVLQGDEGRSVPS